MVNRILEDWLIAYLEYVDNLEQPAQYKVWGGISCLAGALQRRVYWELGLRKTYSNLYIIFVGKSGLGKSQAMLPAMSLFRELGFPIVASATTKEALVAFMHKKGKTKFMNAQGEEEEQAAIQIFSAELVALLGEKNMLFLGWMTDWYDSSDNWDYETKTQGSYHLEGLCPNMLGATAPEWIDVMIPVQAHSGGFTSRTIFIVATKKDHLNPRPKYDAWHKQRYKDLVHDLEQISKLAGVIDVDPQTWEIFDEFYMTQEKALQEGKLPEHITDPGLEGYVTRRPMLLQKLSMIMSVSRSNTLLVKKKDIKKAKRILIHAEKDMAKVFRGLGKASSSTPIFIIETLLKENERISRARLLKALTREFEFDAIETAIKILEEMGRIQTSLSTEDNNVYYRLIK